MRPIGVDEWERTSGGVHRATGNEAALDELVRVSTQNLAILANIVG